MGAQSIPVVDLKDFLSDSPRAQMGFVDAIGDALRDIGFFAVENHGIGQALIDQAYQVTADFFNLSEETKKRYELGNKGQRGFTSFGREHAKNSAAADLKEFWHVGRDVTSGDYPLNVWPDEVSQFKSVMLELYRQLDNCAMALLEACSIYIDEAPLFLPDITRDGNSILRIIHYPPVPHDKPAASIRAAAHEDINLITLLCEATADGLELLQRDGKWRPIKAVRGQLIADAGDMLQNITNGLLRSTTHRVINPENDRERRFSMPYFVHPRSEVDLTPRPHSILKTSGNMDFAPITAGQYLSKRLAEIGLG